MLVVRELGAALQHLDQRLPLAALLVKPLERRQGIGMGRVVLEPLAVNLDRCVRIVKRIFEQFRQRREQLLAARLVFLELDLASKVFREATVIARLAVETLERARRLEHDFGVVPLGADELLVCLFSAFRFRLGYIPELGELDEDLRLHEVVADGGQPGLEKLGALTMATQLGRQSGQVGACAAVPGVLTDGTGVSVERQLVVVKLRLAELANPRQVGGARAWVGQILELHFEHLRELAPGALALEDRVQDGRNPLARLAIGHQALEAFLCAQVCGARLEDELVVVDRVDDAIEPGLVERGELVREVDRILPLGFVEISTQQLGKLGPALQPRVQALQRPPRGRVRRIELERLLVAGDRVRGLVEDLLEQEAELQQEVELGPCIGGRLDALLVERAEILPLLVLGVELLQRGERCGVLRLALQHAPMQASGVLGGSEHDVEQLGGAPAENDLDPLVERARVDRLHHRLRKGLVTVGRLSYAAQSLEEIEVVGVVEERRLERHVRSGGVSELGGRQIGETELQRSTLLRVFRLGEPLPEESRELVEVPAFRVRRLQ